MREHDQSDKAPGDRAADHAGRGVRPLGADLGAVMYRPSAVEIQARLDRKVLCLVRDAPRRLIGRTSAPTANADLAEDELRRRQNSHPEASLFPPKE